MTKMTRLMDWKFEEIWEGYYETSERLQNEEHWGGAKVGLNNNLAWSGWQLNGCSSIEIWEGYMRRVKGLGLQDEDRQANKDDNQWRWTS